MESQEHNKKPIVIGISVGDINGIGIEIILKSFADERMLELCTPVLFASNKIVAYQKKTLKINVPFQSIAHPSKSVAGKINVVNSWKEEVKTEFGQVTEDGGKYALKSLQSAVAALKEGHVEALVTAPINKNNIQSEEFKFPGHTDYLAQELGGESLMFMITENLRVGLITDHVALKDVVNEITSKQVNDKIRMMLRSLQIDFGISKPKIAVLGINPHCGDDGVIGNEDQKILIPIIKERFAQGDMVFGPFPADGFFGSEQYLNYDAVLAPYHDQGLVPFKTLSFGKGVNFTAGLNKVRTSPDHGTAYEIAGQGKADHSSFRSALYAAIDISKTREEETEIRQNPLKKQRKEREYRKS